MGRTTARRGTFIRSVPYDNGGPANFALKLRAAMVGRNLTRKQLAFRSGVADTTISQMTSHTGNATNHKVSLYVLVGLADGLNLPAAEVIGWATTHIISEYHIAEARITSEERARRYRAQAEAEAQKQQQPQKPEPRTFFPPQEPVRVIEPVRLAPEVTVASVMLKIRSLSNEDLVIVDELLSGLVQ